MTGPSTITSLPASAAITGGEVLPMDQGGNGKSVSSTVANIITGSSASTAITGAELLLQSPTAGSVKNTSVSQLITQATASAAIVGTELLPNTASGTYQSTSISQLINQSTASASVAGTESILQSPSAGSVKKTTIAQLTSQATASGALVGTESFPNVTAGGAYQKSTIAQVVSAVVQQQPTNSRNYFVDPACRVAQSPGTFNLSTSYQYGQVDLVQHKATGTAVSAGVLIAFAPISAPASTGYCSRISGATITGSGVVFGRRWLESLDAASLSGPGRNNTATFSCVVQQNTGSAINYTITLNSANSINNFAATTNIATSGNISVPSGVPTTISFTTALNAASANGIEMVVQGACGAVTTKNFDFTDWGAVVGSNVLPIQIAPFDDDYNKVQRYFEKSYEYGTIISTATTQGAPRFPNPIATANSNIIFSFQYRRNKVVSPNTFTIFSTGTGASGKIRDESASADITVSISPDTTTYQIVNNSGGALTIDHILSWHYSADSRL